MGLLAKIVRQFDVLAVQEISSRNYDVVRNLVDLANRDEQFCGPEPRLIQGPKSCRAEQRGQ